MQSAIFSFLAGAVCASGVALLIARYALGRVRDEFEGEIHELEDALARDAILARRPALLASLRSSARRASADSRGLAPLFRTLCDSLGARRAWLLSACCTRETTSAWEFDASDPKEVRTVTLPSSGIEPLARLALESDGALHIPAGTHLAPGADPIHEARRRIGEAGSADAIVAAVCPPTSRPWLLGAEFGSGADRWGPEEMEILAEAAGIIAGEIERAMLQETVQILRRQVRAHTASVPAGSADLNAIAARVVDAVVQTPAARVHVDLQLGASLPAVAADPVDVEHLVFNACLNARAATAAYGTILIETTLVEEDGAGACRRFVELRVSDDGGGGPSRTETARGSKLGFWTPDEIASKLGAQADWTHGPRGATTLRVRFPVGECARAPQLA